MTTETTTQHSNRYGDICQGYGRCDVCDAVEKAALAALPPVLIVGNTHPFRGQLRELGGVWTGTGWKVPGAVVAKALAISPRNLKVSTGSSAPQSSRGCTCGHCMSCIGE